MEHLKRALAVELVYNYYGYCLEDLRFGGNVKAEKPKVISKYVLISLIYKFCCFSENEIAEFLRCKRGVVSFARTQVNRDYYPGIEKDYNILSIEMDKQIALLREEVIKNQDCLV